jgi:hypothetical protein
VRIVSGLSQDHDFEPRTGHWLPADVRPLSWAAEQLGIGVTTAYRLAPLGQIPGAFKVGAQWRVSVPRFERVVHGGETEPRST